MDYSSLINLNFLMSRTSGSPDIAIGLIDGPVLINHPDLNKNNIREIPANIAGSCSKEDSLACSHGTFIAGILKAERNSKAPAICPECSLLIRPIFNEQIGNNEILPSTNPEELSQAIIDCINEGARIINLSLAITNPSLKNETGLKDALSYATNKGVIIIAAAGNQSNLGSTTITRHPGVIPVVACNSSGNPLQSSNLGNSIGRNGLMAPGENIISLGTSNVVTSSSGTSVAVPFVTGIIALLWSEFPNLSTSIIKQAIGINTIRRSIVPPLIDARISYEFLNSNYSRKAVA